MQDDNLQNMEYLLTKEAFEKWLDDNFAETLEDIKNHKLTVTQNYFKEHGLPLDSLIKD